LWRNPLENKFAKKTRKMFEREESIGFQKEGLDGIVTENSNPFTLEVA
jgi:hypothetical protein